MHVLNIIRNGIAIQRQGHLLPLFFSIGICQFFWRFTKKNLEFNLDDHLELHFHFQLLQMPYTLAEDERAYRGTDRPIYPL